MISDADEQLIIRYAWNDIVYCKYILLRASKGPKDAGDEDEEEGDKPHPPKTLKIFDNRPALDFDDAEQYNPSITVELTADQVKDGNIKIDISKKFAKAVRNIQFFIEDNQGGTEKTYLNMLKVYGTFGAKLNMDDLKKSG